MDDFNKEYINTENIKNKNQIKNINKQFNTLLKGILALINGNYTHDTINNDINFINEMINFIDKFIT